MKCGIYNKKLYLKKFLNQSVFPAHGSTEDSYYAQTSEFYLIS